MTEYYKKIDIRKLFDHEYETIEAENMSQNTAFRRKLVPEKKAYVSGKYIKHEDGKNEWVAPEDFDKKYEECSLYENYSKELHICIDVMSSIKDKMEEIGSRFGIEYGPVNKLVRKKLAELNHLACEIHASFRCRRDLALGIIEDLSYEDAMYALEDGCCVYRSSWMGKRGYLMKASFCNLKFHTGNREVVSKEAYDMIVRLYARDDCFREYSPNEDDMKACDWILRYRRSDNDINRIG